METLISTEQSQAFMFAYEQVSGVKYIYTSHIPAIYSILIRSGFKHNEETIEGLRKAIALKFFGDVYVSESNEEIGSFLKGFSFQEKKWRETVEYHWAEGYVDSNKILKCHLYYNQNSPLFEY